MKPALLMCLPGEQRWRVSTTAAFGFVFLGSSLLLVLAKPYFLRSLARALRATVEA